MKISLKPIDVGFDVRVLKMPVNLSEDVTEVEIDGNANGTKTVVISGSREEIVRKLRARGFRIAKSGAARPERIR